MLNSLSFRLNDDSAASGRRAALMHGDDGFTDHLGSMPLLARQIVTSFARALKGVALA
jgi:hypothetical protein